MRFLELWQVMGEGGEGEECYEVKALRFHEDLET